MIKVFRKNEGIIYLGTVIMVLVLFGLMSYTLSNLLVISNGKTANLYLDTQAELAAVAGVEYAFYHLVDNFANWTGTSDYIIIGKSKFFVEVDTLDEDGTKLNSDIRRVVSTGVFERSIKKIQVKFSAQGEVFSFSLYIKELEDPQKKDYILIGKNNDLKGHLFFGTNVYVKTSRSRIDTTTIYVTPGHVVTSDDPFDDTYNWQVYPPPFPEFPIFDTTIHDSLLAIASSITSTSGNKINGNLTIDSEWDLSAYENNTIFIKGNLTVTGSDATIPSETTQNPGWIIVDGTVDYKSSCSVGDNIITIASGDIAVISTGTQYGLDWSHLPFNDRPSRVNELFSYTNIDISAGVVFANVESLGDLQLRGTIYAICYSTGTVEIESATFQGAIVANATKLDRITNSEMEFIPPLPGSATGGLKPTIVPGSWKML
ncbi:MAG: hypothetical protein IIA61_05265 [Candidatus Marinimicrobia bacterium]|nr:hypothetical protein [Candidatus Neomarinimicrobiota bacterium]